MLDGYSIKLISDQVVKLESEPVHVAARVSIYLVCYRTSDNARPCGFTKLAFDHDNITHNDYLTIAYYIPY